MGRGPNYPYLWIVMRSDVHLRDGICPQRIISPPQSISITICKSIRVGRDGVVAGRLTWWMAVVDQTGFDALDYKSFYQTNHCGRKAVIRTSPKEDEMKCPYGPLSRSSLEFKDDNDEVFHPVINICSPLNHFYLSAFYLGEHNETFISHLEFQWNISYYCCLMSISFNH